MSDDYLFDPSAPEDPAIRRIERALETWRLRDRAPPDVPSPPAVTVRAPAPRPALAAAALLLAAFLATPRFAAAPQRDDGWTVTAAGRDATALRRGAVVATGAGETAAVRVPGVGILEVAPESRLRVLGDGARGRAVALDLGSVRAVTTAPPRLFHVVTPAARAVDLGCVFTVEVAADGTTRVAVDAGSVSLEGDGRERFVPAGAVCLARPGSAPGTPRRRDTARALAEALDRIDAGARDLGALDAALAAAGPDDTLALWHLAADAADGAARARVHDRVAALAPGSAAEDRGGVVAGDGAALLAWRDVLARRW